MVDILFFKYSSQKFNTNTFSLYKERPKKEQRKYITDLNSNVEKLQRYVYFMTRLV